MAAAIRAAEEQGAQQDVQENEDEGGRQEREGKTFQQCRPEGWGVSPNIKNKKSSMPAVKNNHDCSSRS